jgi:2-oxoglutarate dehydrogenase E1 component
MLSRQLRSLSLRRWAQRPSRSPLVLHRYLATPSPNDPFANGTNAYYAEEMYRHWRQDPNSVHASWNVYFSGLDKGLPSSIAFSPPPSLLPAPADGAPALHSNGGAELDVHLKVRCTFSFIIHLLTCVATDPTTCSSISSSWTPCRRTRPFRHS